MTSSKLKSNSKSDSKSWEKKNRSGYDRANFFTKYFCLFVTPFLYRHYSDENFDLDAIDHCSKDDKCERLGNNLQKHWTVELEKHRSGKCASLLRAIFKAFGLQFFGTNLKNFFVYGVFRMGMPMILGRIIYYSNEYFDDKIWFQDNENKTVNASEFDTYNLVPQNVADPDILNQYLHLNNRQNVILYSGFLAVVIFINVCVSHPNFFAKYRYGMNVRVAVTRLVYEKALQISQQTVQRITAGKIVNLISNDANRFDNAYVYVEFLYTAVLETSIGMYFMYQYIGRSCFGIVGILVFYIPFQIISAKVLNKFRIQSIVLTDNRLRLMTEILSAMRVIKMYVWERPFAALVSKARKQEIGKIRNSMNMRALNLALDFVAPKIMSFTCLILFILDNGKLTAENVFVTMALIAQIRDIITYMFPMGITFGVEAYVSVKRIEKFLLEDEIEHSISRRKSLGLLNPKKVFNPKISLKRVTCQIKNTRILKDISFDVTPGNVTCLIGPVGSGKSTVLQCILRELPVSGQVDVDGKLIYVPQEAWIFNGTVRENILFGAEFDPVRYRKVVRASALSEDFKQFSESDQTVVDDRGTSLSGGQRARISLARALYADADCYLLDDPLSAVDASVAKHIFEECIKDYLKDKCVVLVTHQVQFAKSVDQVVVLKDGACLAKGTYMDIVNQGIDIFKYAATEAEKPQPHQPNSVDSPLSSPLISRHAFAFRTESINSIENLPTGNVSEIDCGASSVGDYIDFDTNNNPVSTQKRLSVHNVEMNNSNDKSKFKIYWIYIQAGAGILLFSTFVISNFVSQILFTGSDFWLSAWTDFLGKSAKHDLNHNFTYEVSPIISRDKNTNMYIYSGLIAILFIFSFIRTFTFFTICMRASVNFHNRIFASLIQAPILFFDKTPLGIILNRVSRDLGIIDDILPPAAFDALAILFNSFGVFILCTVLNYWIIIPFVALMVMIYFANRFYVNTARQVKRLEGVARSPLLNQMSTTLAGLATIRSYGKEDMFLERFSETQDLHSAIYFTFIAASRFYGIFLEFVCVAYIYCFILMMNFNLDNYTASLIGLTISQTLQLTNTFNWGIRQYAEVETFMTSVERINEFGQLNTEELDKGQREPAENWPTRGDVLYRNVGLIYKNPADSEEPAKTVLHDLTFSIQSGEKIGIVGRTGAGKSSLITTLFRLTQPIGSIWIDGVSTGEISLSRLRKALSIIPQEPILFSGDIRHNLDPFNEKSDEELWDAITKVQLKSKIKSLPGMLSAPVSECGADFSVGQKQLICMARAILRKNRILILDEATANVDPGTDSLIQQTIRNEFGHCTVMTIAHRLNTIIDYDRVMVLDAGSLAQFDSPYALIKQQSGIFYEYLYSNLNKESRDELYKAAKKAYTVKQFQSQL